MFNFFSMLNYISMEEQKTQVVNLIPDRFRFQESLKKGTMLSFSSINVNRYKYANPSEGQKISYSAALSASNMLDSSPVLEGQFTTTITWSDASAGALKVAALRNNFGFNDFPMNRLINNQSVRLNGTTQVVSNPIQDVQDLKYTVPMDKCAEISMQAFADKNTVYNNTFLSDALRLSNDSIAKVGTRGIDTGFDIQFSASDASAATSVVITYKLSEALISRPWQVLGNKQPFVGISDLQVDFSLVNSFTNALIAANLVAMPTITAITTTCQSLDLIFKQYTPHVNFMQQPKRAYWNIPQMKGTSSIATTLTTATVSATGVVSYQSAVVQTATTAYSAMPKLFLVYAIAERTGAGTPDIYLPITNLKLNVGLKQNQLVNYSASDLYILSQANGLTSSEGQFFTRQNFSVGAGGNVFQPSQGCVCVIKPSDIDTELFNSSNAAVNVAINAEATVLNPLSRSVSFKLRLTAVNDAVLEYNNGIYSETYSVLSPAELEQAENQYISYGVPNMVLGGAWWNNWNDFTTMIKPVVSQVRKAIPKLAQNVAEYVPVVAPEARMIGQAVEKFNEGSVGRAMDALGYGQKKQKKVKGGYEPSAVMLGGQQLSNADLLRLLTK